MRTKVKIFLDTEEVQAFKDLADFCGVPLETFARDAMRYFAHDIREKVRANERKNRSFEEKMADA
jgi:hypothetical protein